MEKSTEYRYELQDKAHDYTPAGTALARLSEYAPEVAKSIDLDYPQDPDSNREMLAALHRYDVADHDRLREAVDDVAVVLTDDAPHLEYYVQTNILSALYELKVCQLRHPAATSADHSEFLAASAGKLSHQMCDPITRLRKQLDGTDIQRLYAATNPVAFANDYGYDEQASAAKALLDEHRNQLVIALKGEGVHRHRGQILG